MSLFTIKIIHVNPQLEVMMVRLHNRQEEIHSEQQASFHHLKNLIMSLATDFETQLASLESKVQVTADGIDAVATIAANIDQDVKNLHSAIENGSMTSVEKENLFSHLNTITGRVDTLNTKLGSVKDALATTDEATAAETGGGETGGGETGGGETGGGETGGGETGGGETGTTQP